VKVSRTRPAQPRHVTRGKELLLRRQHGRKAERSEPITVILPPESPELTPGAARVLPRILLKARQKQLAGEQEADAPTGTPAPRGD
jgi:hypothetical protein